MNTPETTAERILELPEDHVLVFVISRAEQKDDNAIPETITLPLPDVQTLAREYLRKRWIPVEERLPVESAPVEVTTIQEFDRKLLTCVARLLHGEWWVSNRFNDFVAKFHRGEIVIAWRKLGEPYQPPDPFAEGCPTCGCLPGEDHDEERECGAKGGGVG